MNIKSMVTSWILAILLLILVTHLSQNQTQIPATPQPDVTKPEKSVSGQQQAAQQALALPMANRVLIRQG